MQDVNNTKQNIRNFCIIAHIDHGKSTLADRFLELTGTIEKRKMHEQYLDQMELERERGITIKMQPVRMNYELRSKNYELNLIDTPGHIDFSYEVSRSLRAVEAVVLLVDATQGVQAQTIGNLETAKSLGLVIIPVINKIDSSNARIEETKKEIVEILGCKDEDILKVSARTGEGVELLLGEIVRRTPPADTRGSLSHNLRALVFDFDYSPHRGVLLYARIMSGFVKKDERVFLYQAKSGFRVAETGIFTPELVPVEKLEAGEIGYVVTNIKEPGIARVGDTLLSRDNPVSPLEGYHEPLPVVWAGVFPESQSDFEELKRSLERFKLSDSALTFEQEKSGILGRGFRCGFLGMLHLEIVMERLKREFDLKLITASPSVVYRVEDKKGEIKKIYSPVLFPERHEIKKIFEPWVETRIITPFEKINDVIKLLKKHDALIGETGQFGRNRTFVKAEMPLREMMSNFFDRLKSITEGFVSFDYRLSGEKEADLARLDVVLNDEKVPVFSRVVRSEDTQTEAQKIADKLKEFLPRALFVIKIQVKAEGRILAGRSIAALKKNVTGHLYGGDRTRKMKLWQKQKRGKKKLQKFGKVNISQDVFLKMLK